MSPCASTDLPAAGAAAGAAAATTQLLFPSPKGKGFHRYATAHPTTQTLEINTGINVSSLIFRCVKNMQLEE